MDRISDSSLPLWWLVLLLSYCMLFISLTTDRRATIYLCGTRYGLRNAHVPCHHFTNDRSPGGTDRWVWFILANLLSLAAVCPFTGSISDLIGRRWVALIGAGCIVVGMIICSTAHTMNIFICGMVFAGIGAGVNELTALAATSELAPTSQRGKYVAVLVFTIVPFCPSVLYAQLIAYYSSWRWIGCFCAIWAFIGLVITACFYFPPPRVNSQGLSRRQVLGEIDYLGGLLSISGMLLFMMGMQWGG